MIHPWTVISLADVIVLGLGSPDQFLVRRLPHAGSPVAPGPAAAGRHIQRFTH